MKPRQSYNIYDDEWEDFIEEYEITNEDEAMQREQDIRDHYEDENDADDLKLINIG